MEHKVTLTNGAAHWGIQILTSNKCNMADLFISGSLAGKLKGAKSFLPREGESAAAFGPRQDEWLDAPYSKEPLEVTQSEYEFMRSVLKGLGEKKELPGNLHVAQLCIAFGLDKP